MYEIIQNAIAFYRTYLNSIPAAIQRHTPYIYIRSWRNIIWLVGKYVKGNTFNFAVESYKLSTAKVSLL